MGLTNEHVRSKVLEKIKVSVLTRAELLFNLCYEIPCILKSPPKTHLKVKLNVSLYQKTILLPVSFHFRHVVLVWP